MEGEDDFPGAAGEDEGREDRIDWMEEHRKTSKDINEDDVQDALQAEHDGNNHASKPSEKDSTAPDVRVTRFECSDSIADLVWSASDPWIYATLSCDGGFVVHHVPSKEKYKILL